MGGGSLRTAAKAAIFGQYRSPIPFFGLSSSSSSGAPASGGRATVEPPPAISLIPGDNGMRQDYPPPPPPPPPAAAAPEWQSWRVDDWEFTGLEDEDDDADLASPGTRVVFGSVPTLEEVKEATNDLKVALDKVHFWNTAADDNEKFGRGTSDVESSSIVPPMPGPVVQAFSLLQQSPEAQSVVASVACDKNVWDALMKNEKVVEFYRNHQPTSTAQNAFPEGSSENFSDPSADNSVSSVLTDLMKSMKNNVREMVNSLSNFLHEFFVATETQCTTIMRGSNEHFDAIGTSFLALAIAVILVVVVKRSSL